MINNLSTQLREGTSEGQGIVFLRNKAQRSLAWGWALGEVQRMFSTFKDWKSALATADYIWPRKEQVIKTQILVEQSSSTNGTAFTHKHTQ